MELERVLVRVAPDGSGIGMACVLGEVIQADAVPSQQGEASASPPMSRDSTLGIFDIYLCLGAQNRYQR